MRADGLGDALLSAGYVVVLCRSSVQIGKDISGTKKRS